MKSTNSCHHLTLDDMDDGSVSYLDSSNKDSGIVLNFKSDEVCNETTKEKYGLTLQIGCADEDYTPEPIL